MHAQSGPHNVGAPDAKVAVRRVIENPGVVVTGRATQASKRHAPFVRLRARRRSLRGRSDLRVVHTSVRTDFDLLASYSQAHGYLRSLNDLELHKPLMQIQLVFIDDRLRPPTRPFSNELFNSVHNLRREPT